MTNFFMMFEIVDLPTDTLPVIPINNGCMVPVLAFDERLWTPNNF